MAFANFKANRFKFSLEIAYIYSSSRFNLPSDLVFLMGPRRLIPMVKTQYLLRKTHLWVNKKPLKET